jgi:hypothetical protein
MRSESYKAWIDAMPIDDVRRRIERIERKLADLHVLERLYGERNGDGGPESAAEAQDSGSEGLAPEGGGWTQGEGSPEHA